MENIETKKNKFVETYQQFEKEVEQLESTKRKLEQIVNDIYSFNIKVIIDDGKIRFLHTEQKIGNISLNYEDVMYFFDNTKNDEEYEAWKRSH